MPPLKAIPYLRVSTDDKGQDPDRQMVTITPWADREGITLLEPVVDEGTSAFKTDPFDRKRFMEAVLKAKAAGAAAIVVETADRFSRMGSDEFVYARFRLGKDYDLKLWLADLPLKSQDSAMGRLMAYVQATQAHEFSANLSRRTKEGLALSKAKMGRPAKPLNAAEMSLAIRLQGDGRGYQAIAAAVNDLRGIHKLATPEARARRSISSSVIRRALALSKVPPLPKVDGSPTEVGQHG